MVGPSGDPDEDNEAPEITDEALANSYQTDESGPVPDGFTFDIAADGNGRLLKIVTINLRHDNDDPDRRFPLIAAEIARLKPDIVGLQEVEIFDRQATRLRDMIKDRGGYSYGVYDHLKTGWALFAGEGIGILSRFPMEKTGYIDLSEGRIAVWARVRIAADTSIEFYNTHLHSEGGDAVRLPQAQKITAWIAQQSAGKQVFLTGDMNATESQGAIKHYVASGLVDSFRAVHGADTAALGPTSPIVLKDGATQNPKNRIDFIFGRGPGVESVTSEVAFKNHDSKGFYPSDHLGVTTTFRLP